jgi:hypothetical protein
VALAIKPLVNVLVAVEILVVVAQIQRRQAQLLFPPTKLLAPFHSQLISHLPMAQIA